MNCIVNAHDDMFSIIVPEIKRNVFDLSKGVMTGIFKKVGDTDTFILYQISCNVILIVSNRL